MKFNFLNARTVNILIGIFVLLFIASLPFFTIPTSTSVTVIGSSSSFSSSSSSSYEMNSGLSPIDLEVPDTLPHKTYVRLTDSIKRSRQLKNGIMKDWSSSIGGLGVTSLEMCEYCKDWTDDKPKVIKHFVSLNWWVLDTTNRMAQVRYYVKNGQPHLRKFICKQKGTATNDFICNEVEVAVPFYYDPSNKNMLVPVDGSLARASKIALFSLGFLMLLYFIYVVFGGFVKVLIEIANGTPFSVKNVMRLKWIALSFLLVSPSFFLLNLLMRLVFYRYFTSDIKLSPQAWDLLWKSIVLGLIFGALFFAFKKGKKLKDEQDLTV